MGDLQTRVEWFVEQKSFGWGFPERFNNFYWFVPQQNYNDGSLAAITATAFVECTENISLSHAKASKFENMTLGNKESSNY